MAIFCLSRDLEDLQRRLGNIVIGYTRGDQAPVTAAHMEAPGAMTALLRDALAPNLVQTLENNPAFIHGGPFANIAHGCNSIIATETALKRALVPISVRRSSSISSVENLVCTPRRWLLSPPCAP